VSFKHHVAFRVQLRESPEDVIVEHFRDLGYRLVESDADRWVFHRGSKLAALWRMNIRAYSTELKVRLKPLGADEMRVSCDFEIWTFMTVILSGDIATLEAEARGLESALEHFT
jgi:hypothetical protein